MSMIANSYVVNKEINNDWIAASVVKDADSDISVNQGMDFVKHFH